MKKSKRGMNSYFLWIMLAAPISLVVTFLTGCGESQTEELRAQAEQKKGSLLRNVLRPELFGRTDKAIHEEIDLAFEPIYSGVPEFLDWHYSVLGQYQQFSAAVLRELESEAKSRLFSGVNERLESASEKIDGVFEDEFLSLISAKIQDEAQTVDDAARATYESLLNEAMSDSIQRFSSSAPFSVAAVSEFIRNKAVFDGIAKEAVKKIAAAVVKKAAMSAAAKTKTVVGGAAAGAAAGSPAPGIGTWVGATIGAVAAWLGIDVAQVKLDEYWNRDEFEQELIASIDKAKADLKSDLESSRSKTLARVPPAQL